MLMLGGLIEVGGGGLKLYLTAKMRMRQERRARMILLLMGNPVQSCFLSVSLCVFRVRRPDVFRVNIKVALSEPSERERERELGLFYESRGTKRKKI